MPTDTRADRLYRQAAAFQDALAAREGAAAEQMSRAWLNAQQRVSVEMASLLDRMEAARLAGTPVSPAWLYQERRLARLQQVIREAVSEWAPLADATTRQAVEQAVALGESHARQLTAEAAAHDLPGVDATFTDINPANMTQIMANTAPGGPVRNLLQSIAGEMAEQAAHILTQGVILGQGIAPMARALAQTLDIPRHRAETIARTEALRAYRETSRLTYQASNVVDRWEWFAALDRRTCPACVVMHGTTHPVTETLDGHPRCRCAMVPVTKTFAQLGLDPSLDELYPRPVTQSGKDWLADQPLAVQRQVLGPLKFDAWKRGDVSLDDMVARTYSPEWGSMRRERSMVEIRAGRNPNMLPTVPAAVVPPVPAVKPAWTPPWKTMEPESWDDAMRGVNPRYGDGPEWTNNCTNTTLAWELRRRGYDVTALPRPRGRDMDELVKGYGVEPKDVRNGTFLQSAKAISEMPEGSRGAIVVQWRQGGAHVFNWEIRDGQVHWIDAQPGRIHTHDDLKAMVKGGKYGSFWFRLDNHPMTPSWADNFVEP